MRVLFDLRGAQEQWYPERGIPRYVAGHAEALARHAAISEIYGLIEPQRPVPPVGEVVAARGELVSPRHVGRLLDGRGLVHHVSTPFEFGLARQRVLPSVLHRPDVTRAVTLYDVIPLAFAAPLSQWQLRMWTFRAEVIRSADIVLCISEFTARDGMQRLGLDPSRVRTIGAGVPAVEEATLESLQTPPDLPGLEPPFVLVAGGADPRKNVEALVRAFARLPADLRSAHQLVVVSTLGRPQREQLREVASRAGVEDRVLLAGYVSDRVLRGLFATCRCFVYPSLYEGLGLPLLEAMSHGAPTITSNTTGCAEVTAHPDATFDPTDEADMSAAMLRVLSDPEHERMLREHGRQRAAPYTWESVADSTVAAYAHAARTSHARPSRRPDRESVVFASWSAPSAASPAHALLLLAAAASRYLRVSFTTPASLRPRRPGFRVLPPTALKPALRWLTGPLVCLADSPDAAERSAELLQDRPGVVILWDLDVLLSRLATHTSGGGLDALRVLAELSDRVVVASAFDARRVELAVGRPVPPTPVVMPPPLGWLAGGRLGHELPFGAAVLSNPQRENVRSQRPTRLLLSPRRPALGPFDWGELEHAADLAIALANRGVHARVQLLGRAAREPVVRAHDRCAQAGAAFAHADWPRFRELAAWTTAADAFIDLGGSSVAAAQATVDHALLADRPALLVGHSITGTPAVHSLPASATPAELAHAAEAVLAAPRTAGAQALSERGPACAAQTLLETLGIVPSHATAPVVPARLLRPPRMRSRAG